MSVFKLTGFECGGIVMELFGRPVTEFLVRGLILVRRTKIFGPVKMVRRTKITGKNGPPGLIFLGKIGPTLKYLVRERTKITG